MTVNADLMRAFIIRFALSVAGLLVVELSAIAQVVPDQTLSSPSLVNTSGSTTTINGGATAGTNLFHSFSQFSIPSGSTAFFNNSPAINNIITRVTGDSLSLINGAIQANGAANLFLINPNGIIFGPNASLNIGGSFVASTANSFTFADGFQYSATNPQTVPLLAVNVPIGLQYGKVAQPLIAIGSSLSVKSGKTLALAGGDISLDRTTLRASGGRIDLGGLSDSGTVGLTFNGNIPSLKFSKDVARSDASLTNSALRVAASGGGDITINAQNINISDGILGAGLLSGTGSRAGNITLSALDQITVTGSLIYNIVLDQVTGNGGDIIIAAKSLSLTKGTEIGTGLVGKGSAGDINIVVDSLSLQKGAQLQTNNSGSGNAGNINIIASDAITLDGTNDQGVSSRISSILDKGAQGKGGNISISTNSLALSSEAIIGSAAIGTGNAGDISISAKDSVVLDSGTNIFNGSISRVGGDAGDISISTKALKLNNGATVLNATVGQGNTGSISVAATDIVEVDGANPNNFSTINISTGSESSGNGGDISISTKELKLSNGGSILNGTLGQGNTGSISIAVANKVDVDGSSIYDFGNSLSGLNSSITVFTGTESSGDGGYIDISTRSLSLTNGGLIWAGSQGKGVTGDIVINASDFVLLDGVGPLLNGGILNNPPLGGSGGAGNIVINTKSLQINNGAAIYALQSGSQTTGNIDITATESVNISGEKQSNLPSRIASATFTNLPSGDIRINTPTLNIVGQGSGGLDQTGVTATSRGTGNAGDININASTVTVDGGEIAAIMEYNALGDGGSITVTANTLRTFNGGNIKTSTLSARGGDAGDITFFLSDGLNLSGNGSGVFANTGINSTGKGGNIFIDPPMITIFNGAAIAVDSKGSGTGGSIVIRSDALKLDNGIISAATVSNNGGNVKLGVKDLLLANSNSTISATAGGNGNGGNLDINAGFVVLNQNSDIAANAFQGQGGNIQIATQGLFQARDSTITASSQLGINGTVQLNVTDLDPSRGLFSLPETVVDASRLVAQKCDAAVSKELQQSEFVVTGRGGLQPNPGESLQDESILSNWVTLQPHSTQSSEQPSVMIAPSAKKTNTIVIAQGWKVDSDGTVILTAEPNSVTSAPTWQPSVKCRA
jgi:filamentous hemagglutinin family protein